MRQPNEMSPADVLAALEMRKRDMLRFSDAERHEYSRATDAVAALIERNAELERQNDEILARNVDLDKSMGALEAERDALAERHAATERDACLQAERANELVERVKALESKLGADRPKLEERIAEQEARNAELREMIAIAEARKPEGGAT